MSNLNVNDTLMTIPLDVIRDILLQLPAKPLLRFKCVCKSWYNLINDPSFIRRHVEQSLATQSNLHFVIRTPMLHLADFDTFDNPVELDYPFKNSSDGGGEIVGSCNGLFCLWNYDYGLSLFLYNPTTQTHKILPDLPIIAPFSFRLSKFDIGFGYDNISEDYKCVRILQNHDKEAGSVESEVMVYSLKSDSWRRGPDVPYYFHYHNGLGNTALLNETVHWVGDNGDRIALPIVAFNLRDETFSSIPLPDFDAQWNAGMFVGVLDGFLCLSVSYVDNFDVWVMKEYGVAASWTCLFSVDKRTIIEHLERPIFYSLNRKELFVRICLLKVAAINLETLQIRDVKVAGFHKCVDAHVCVENLLMLKDVVVDVPVGEENQGQKKSKRRKRRKHRR
ncbi:hypothetical protein BVRB_8g181180 [Beta vulgaris subsp. vulgaris]|uniref:F-box protein CPR1 n=1 Tax=Beta vulgaris subsp. vulgaris TaxID=3555 RepID=UPI00053FC20F|nr:F-box protein CPR1 [Beta vulgaris subsp. vulgaris]KMT04445.1 hypothetical protein BVRB_8g181180 [Beta vulgaris subsp. vulgaris]